MPFCPQYELKGALNPVLCPNNVFRYLQDSQGICRTIAQLDAEIENTEALVEIQLDTARNRLLTFGFVRPRIQFRFRFQSGSLMLCSHVPPPHHHVPAALCAVLWSRPLYL